MVFELPKGLRAALQGHRQSPGEGCGAVPWAAAGKVPPGPGHLNAAVLGEMPKGSPGGWSREGGRDVRALRLQPGCGGSAPGKATG